MRLDIEEMGAEIDEHLRSINQPTMAKARRLIAHMELPRFDGVDFVDVVEPPKRQDYRTVYRLTMQGDYELLKIENTDISRECFKLGVLYQQFVTFKPRIRQEVEDLYVLYCNHVEEHGEHPTLHEMWVAYTEECGGALGSSSYESEMSKQRQLFQFRRDAERWMTDDRL